MGFPIGNQYAAKDHLFESVLRREVKSDNGKRLRRGMTMIVDRYAQTGDLACAVFIRDTLDGKPKQRMEVDDKQGNALSSLQVMFVQALSDKIAENNQQLNVIQQIPEDDTGEAQCRVVVGDGTSS